MARWFVQHLAIYNNENLPNSKKIPKVVSKFCTILNKLHWDCVQFENFAKSGHTGYKRPMAALLENEWRLGLVT